MTCGCTSPANREFRQLHHYHVIAIALRELNERLQGQSREQALDDLRQEINREDQP
jgi:hypothetical protein